MSLCQFQSDSHPKMKLHDSWELNRFSENSQSDGWIPATIPGSILNDLHQAGQAPNPIDNPNDEFFRVIAEEAWHLRTRFDFPDYEFPLGDGAHLQLVCEALDTFAQIALDGESLGKTENMFRSHRFDLGEEFEGGEHELDILLASPAKVSKHYMAESLAVRKMRAGFGTEMTPSLLSSGICQPVYLQGWRYGRIVWFRPEFKLDGSNGKLTLHISVQANDFELYTVEAQLTSRHHQIVEGVEFTCESDDEQVVKIEMDISDPDLWWPAGEGDQPLYTAELLLKRNGEEIHRIRQSFGLRTIEWLGTDDPEGIPLIAKVNGREIFLRGASMLPADLLNPYDPKRNMELIKCAADAKINLLKIWNGGIYAPISLLREADKRGVLIWQDIPSIGNTLPESAKDELKLELEEAVQQRAMHPSLALWGLDEHAGQSSFLPEMVADIISEFHPGHGPVIHSENEVNLLPEFGAPALPSLQTLVAVTGNLNHPQQRELEELFTQTNGAEKMIHLLATHHRITDDMTRFVRLTQDIQARVLHDAIKRRRKQRSSHGGVIIRHLNDPIIAAGFSILDSSDRPKAAWYQVKRAYMARTIAMLPDGNGVTLSAMNDSQEKWSPELTLRAYNFQGEILDEILVQANVEPQNFQNLANVNPSTWLPDPDKSFLVASLLEREQIEEEGKPIDKIGHGSPIYRAMWFGARFKHLELPDSKVTVSPESRDGLQGVLVKAETLALGVWVDDPSNPDLIFCDNAFDMLPGEERWLEVISGLDDDSAFKPRVWTI